MRSLLRWTWRRRKRRLRDGIVQVQPGKVLVRVGGREARIWGERFARGYGNPDFLAARSQVEWEDGAQVTGEERETILRVLLESSGERGIDVEIE